jgi:uncharacterized membrane protein (UPF0127 family)
MKAKIKNIRNDEIVCKCADVLANSLSKTLGLMGKKKTGGALFKLSGQTKINAAIHMGFMLIPIDVVWIDENGIVVDIKRCISPVSPFNFRTWKIYSPKKPASYILELPEHGAKNIVVGDVLHIDYLD